MDSITHLAIGAVIGEACAGKSLGKKAMVLGAGFQSIPDLDFVAAFFLQPTDNLLAHRGFTHSFLFGTIVTVVFSFLINHWETVKGLSLRRWMMFIGLEVFTHLLLDACNSYGTGWFEPFSHQRISFNMIFVADPLFSVWFGIAVIALMVSNRNHAHRMKWVIFSLVSGSLYLCLCFINKTSVNDSFEKTLQSKNISYTRYFTTPTAMNNLLWYCVAETDAGYHIGYRSVFDKRGEITLTYYPRQRWLLNAIEEEEEVVDLLRFSQGYYTIVKGKDYLEFNDLRFGRVSGWEKTETEFTFHYYLQSPGRNMLVVQRGRFAEWNGRTIRSLLDRIRGK